MRRKSKYPKVLATAAAAVMAIGAPLFASEDDKRIEESFKETYVYRTYLKGDSVKTSIKDGVVTLTGTVAEESHKSLAEETVASLSGVARVDNQLATKAEAAGENDDTWAERRIMLALLLHRNVDAGKTTVVVKDGVATLTGVASSIAQKELAGEYAGDIDGVKELKNDMTVAAPAELPERNLREKMDDASITGQVRTALRTHRSTNAVNTKVETRDGTVTLTGIAGNAAEKSLVSKLVNDIHGVTTVKNEMTVDIPKAK